MALLNLLNMDEEEIVKFRLRKVNMVLQLNQLYREQDGKRYQIIDIYYNGVGIIKPLNPEDMEAGFQRHIAEKQQNQKKTA